MTAKKVADGETRTSRVVGSVDFVRPNLPRQLEGDEKTIKVISGVRCHIPFTIKCCNDVDDAENFMSDVANQVFTEVEDKLSTFNESSEICKVNGLTDNEAHEMSSTLSEVVLAAKEMVKYTRGAFDPSVAPLIKHYEELATSAASRQSSLLGKPTSHQSTEEAKVVKQQRRVVDIWQSLLHQGFGGPSDNNVSKKVKKILEISQWRSAFSVGMYDNNNHKIREGEGMKEPSSWVPSLADEAHNNNKKVKILKRHADARLDLGGIAKGWAVDEIARRLPSPCYVEWGGDTKVKGSHPSGRPWTVAIPEPPSLGELRFQVEEAKKDGQEGPVFTLAKYNSSASKKYLAVLELRDGEAVATSGDCEKVIEKDGKLYSHVMNPRLGRLLELNPVTLAQATVVCKSCMFADALATAAMSKEEPAHARALLDPFRTGFHEPVSDFLLYAREGPKIIRLAVPGVESKLQRDQRLKHNKSSKVVVIGSGLAGMSAALEAADAGATVVILEKETTMGGNSAKATSGINGWGTETQAVQGVADEERFFERDTFRSGKGGNNNPSLVRILSTQSAPALHWLMKRFNIPLTVLSQLGGHSAKRTHRAPPDSSGRPVPIGFLITSTLQNAIHNEYENIEVRCGQTVTRLLYDLDAGGIKTVTGVQVTGAGGLYDLDADSVVIATGGFGCDNSEDGLMQRFRPDLVGMPTTNGNFAQGDGVLLAEEIGAELVDMDKVQLHPTGFIDAKDPSNPTKYLAPEAIRGSGGILVNGNGERFVNELNLRSVVAKAIQDNCGPYRSENYVGPPFAWCILSQQAQEIFGLPVLDFYKDTLGLFEDCKDSKAAAALIGCNETTLDETLGSYAKAKEIGKCHLTNKDVFPAELTSDSKGLVLARVTPSIHYTMGGLSINGAGEVQERVDGIVGHHRHIRKLYAAGEVTGGVHGNNRLGGNSLLECVVFGRVAGERAATANNPESSMFPRARDEDDSMNWSLVVLREVRNTDKRYGMNTREVRFNLHGALQKSGLDVGQFISLRGEMDGETLLGYFSPITRPDDEGVIGILCRTDEQGGPIAKLLDSLRPGSVMYMCPMGGLRLKFEEHGIFFRGKKIQRIGLLAGGTGLAPMLQIIRAFGDYARKYSADIPKHALSLIYAAEEEADLAFMKVLEDVRAASSEYFDFYVFLNMPPIGWTEGVGYVGVADIKRHLCYPPADNDLVVMCGPPIFESAMRKSLIRLGFQPDQWYSYSEGDKVSTND